MAEHHDHDPSVITYKTYFKTWAWLLFLTALALGIGYVNMNEKLKALLLVGTTLLKILVIAAVFMHLRYERVNLILITISPLILAIILFSFTFPETLGNATHVLHVR